MVTDQPQAGGYSPGMASRLDLADGRTVFAKAVSAEQNPDSPGLYRREIAAMRTLPSAAPAPRLLWEYDDGHWVVLVLEWVQGRHPHQPWASHDLDQVLKALTNLADALTPSPVEAMTVVDDLAPLFGRWRSLTAHPEQAAGLDSWLRQNLDLLAEVESGWAEAVEGTTLLHTDLRADNLLITDQGVVVVDWAYTVVGAPWVDLALMLPSLLASTPDLDPQQVWNAFPPAAQAPDQGVNALLAAQAGTLLTDAMKPPPPGINGLREHQHAKGQAALNWLRVRLNQSPTPERHS